MALTRAVEGWWGWSSHGESEGEELRMAPRLLARATGCTWALAVSLPPSLNHPASGSCSPHSGACPRLSMQRKQYAGNDHISLFLTPAPPSPIWASYGISDSKIQFPHP